MIPTMTDDEIRKHLAEVDAARKEFNEVWDENIKPILKRHRLPIRDCCELADVMWQHWPKERKAK
jgi:hypothetical protein